MSAVPIHGSCDPKFAKVREIFEEGFASGTEVGASVSFVLDGRAVVDLWGGTADPETGAPWREDTRALLFSTTKGITATCVHLLAERGKLELDAPIGPSTSFNEDLELESIEFVALAEKLQQRYGERVDFIGWFSGKPLDVILALRVGDLVEYIDRCLSSEPTA